MTSSPTSTASIHAVSQPFALDRNSVFWMIIKRGDGSLFPMQFKFRKFNRKTNSCEWSRFGTSIQGIHMKSTIDYVERKSFKTVYDADKEIKEISLRMKRKD